MSFIGILIVLIVLFFGSWSCPASDHFCGSGGALNGELHFRRSIMSSGICGTSDAGWRRASHSAEGERPCPCLGGRGSPAVIQLTRASAPSIALLAGSRVSGLCFWL
jgi:hypothetical protein